VKNKGTWPSEKKTVWRINDSRFSKIDLGTLLRHQHIQLHGIELKMAMKITLMQELIFSSSFVGGRWRNFNELQPSLFRGFLPGFF